jgi:hypothetical protein
MKEWRGRKGRMLKIIISKSRDLERINKTCKISTKSGKRVEREESVILSV